MIIRPDKVATGGKGRLNAQTKMDGKHLLRVIYEKKENMEIITFYPARRRRYED